MKAALLRGIGNLTLSDIKTPECGSDEVLVKVEACAVCSTDVKIIYRGHRDLKLPVIPGHEISGTISEVGKNVKAFSTDERVQIAPGVCCGSCRYCLIGAENMCDRMRIIGFHLNGGFAQYLLVPPEGIRSGVISSVPDTVPFEEACLAEPVACCLNALNLGRLTKGESIAIFGAGPLGCFFVQLAREMEASSVILVEKDKKRLEFAERFKADGYVHSRGEEVFSIIKRKTGGRGVDILILACSDGKIPGPGINVLAKRGRLLFFSGINKTSQDVAVNYNLIHYQELRIIGAYGCTAGQNKEALKLIGKGVIETKPLITHLISLNELKKGIAVIKDKEGIKVVINKF